MSIKISGAAALAAAVIAAGCATSTGYQKAFSADSAIQGNHQTFRVPLDQTFRAVKTTLVRQGFTIEQVDPVSGVIKATRNLQDPADPNVSYNIIGTADVTADADDTTVTLAASQQTVLHREWYEWWHLLWIIPLFPIGTEYQTVVTHEGNVTDPAFYKDFFASVSAQIAAAPSRRQPEPVVAAPMPVPAANADQPAAPAIAPAPAAAPADAAPATLAPATQAAPAPAVAPAETSAPASAPGDTAPASVPAANPATPAP